MKNPLIRRIPKELISDGPKYLVIIVFMVVMIGVISGMYVGHDSMLEAVANGRKDLNIEDGSFELSEQASPELITAIEGGTRADVRQYFIDKATEEADKEVAKALEENLDATVRAEIEKALYVYGALCRLVEKYDLCGVTVRCFDLLDTVHTTGCLGLSILNARGIYGGCEGDVPALLSMAVLGSITNEPLFLCNPSRFDTKEGYAVFAHCTIPVTMLKSVCLTTHFESGIGVAVQGTFEEGDCTIFKCEGDLSRFHAQEGKIEDVPWSDMLCRTQIKVRLDDFSYFLTKPINNHHIICRGKHAAEAEAFFRLLEK